MPYGLDPAQRQITLLRGLGARCRAGTRQFVEILARQANQAADLNQRLASELAAMQRRHHQLRIDRLSSIDDLDETASATYERGTFIARKERNEVRTKVQKERRRQRKQIELEAQQKRQAALDQFEKSKDEPEKFRVKQKQRAEQSLRPIQQTLIEAQELALRRLGNHELTAVPDPEPPRYQSIDVALEAVQSFHTQAVADLRLAAAAPARRWADGWGLALIIFMAFCAWIFAIYLIHPEPFMIWMIGALPAAGIAGFVANLVFSPAVRRHTQKHLPHVATLVENSKHAARNVLELAKSEAAEMAASIQRRRDQALKQADEWREKQLVEMDQRMDAMLAQATDKLNQRLRTLEKDFRDQIDTLNERAKSQIQEWMLKTREESAAVQAQHATERQEQSAIHLRQREDIIARVQLGLQRGLSRIAESGARFAKRFPDWTVVAANDYRGSLPLERIPVGHLRIRDYLHQQLAETPTASANSGGGDNKSASTLDVAAFLPAELPERLPVNGIIGNHSGILLECPTAQVESARRLVQTILLRLLAAAPAGKVRLTLLDPVGRGQSFAPLMALADHDPELVGHRAWAGPEQIDARLSELTQHMEDILQTYLRDRFATIDQYNALAGAMAEPYRVIAAIGFPAGLTNTSMDHLGALLDGGIRCGIMTVLVIDPETPWPGDIAPLPRDRFLRLRLTPEGQWQHASELLNTLPLETITAPPPAMQAALVEKIGDQAANADRVIIPFTEIARQRCDGSGDTSDGIAVPIGRQGVGRVLEMELGEGVRQHVLIAGKTGSGKSSLLHTIITAAALRYTPNQVHLYLLDFKKGVEFKLYADMRLPHARVIGIESEREFGRSVLERLDAELHRRGELFRSVGVQELGEYRRRTGESMPRVMLVVDEFQELFIRDDRIAQECTMLLDRLVRQGRSFGVHIILASQSLAGAYSLPRNTLGQMAVRVALQCSESDAGLILADDNTAARLLSRPGEAIYNDASGLVEGNQPFQVAWLDHQVHEDTLRDLPALYPDCHEIFGPPVIFEGNRPANWNGDALRLALQGARKKAESALELCGVLGESVAIGPPISFRFSRQAGRNLLIICAEQALIRDVLGALLPSLAADAQGKLAMTYLAGRPDAVAETPLFHGLREAVVSWKFVRPRDAQATIVELAEEVKRRVELGDDHPHPPHVLVIEPLERFRDLRHDESLAFSFDANKPPGPEALATILRDGPVVGVHAVICCGGAEAFTRWVSRASQHDLELRLLGRLSTSDAATLTDSPEAANLGPAAMLLYDESMGRAEKLRVYNLPEPSALAEWLQKKEPAST